MKQNDDKKPTIAFSFASPAVTTKSLVKDEDNTKTTKVSKLTKIMFILIVVIN